MGGGSSTTAEGDTLTMEKLVEAVALTEKHAMKQPNDSVLVVYDGAEVITIGRRKGES